MNESLIVTLSGIVGTVVVILSFLRGRNTEAITEVSAIWEQIDRLNLEIERLQTRNRIESERLNGEIERLQARNREESERQLTWRRAVSDYVRVLRGIIEVNSMKVPPYPDELRDL